MNKEELYNRFIECYEKPEMNKFLEDMDEFFSQNVVIPKGQSRHPYADVLHECIEDISKNLEWFNFSIQDWRSDTSFKNDIKFRIKPQDPVYEWQYAFNEGNGITRLGSRYFTDDEIAFYNGESNTYVKLEWTKRERK